MEYNIKLTEQEIQVIFMGLGEVPLKISGSVFSKINAQVNQKPDDKDHSDKEY